MKKTRTPQRLLVLAFTAFLATGASLQAEDRDDQIEQAFKDSHVYKTQLQKSDLDLDVDNGVAVLSGSVENEEQRRLAEDTVRGLPGVIRVDHSKLRVEREHAEGSDEWIALKVRSALLFRRNVGLAHTDVTVRGGVVTLTGTAASDAEKALAEEYAKDIKGVSRVDNQLRVTEAKAQTQTTGARANDRDLNDADARTAGARIDDASITAQLKSALAVRKSTSALRTEVTTREGVVTINGEAKNAAERDLVTRIAENIDGVRTVNNQMSVRDH